MQIWTSRNEETLSAVDLQQLVTGVDDGVDATSGESDLVIRWEGGGIIPMHLLVLP